MWRSCDNPPFPYKRVEIKDIHGRIYLGFYALNKCWLTTEGHEVIQDPDMWRYIKADSILERAFQYKIYERNLAKSIEAELGYGTKV